MSRVFSDFPDRDEGPEQSELLLPAGRREPASGAPPSGEPARAEFFRAQRRPVLPLLGLIAAVATVAFFFWLGRDDTAPAQALEGGELAPVAAAPGLEPPLPAAAGLDAEALPPDPGALGAAAAPQPAPMPAVPSVLDAPAAAPPPEAIPGEGSPGAGGFAVQLLAARSESDVGASWERLRGSYPDLLAALSPSVTRTSRAPGETFFRLRAGPLRDRASADALCRELSQRQQSCFVVSPGS
jgi:cell division septation protein DedD